MMTGMKRTAPAIGRVIAPSHPFDYFPCVLVPHIISLRKAKKHETRYYFKIAKNYFK